MKKESRETRERRKEKEMRQWRKECLRLDIEEEKEFMSVARLKELLDEFPNDAKCYAYEGEICGVVVVKKGKQLGYIGNGGVLRKE